MNASELMTLANRLRKEHKCTQKEAFVFAKKQLGLSAESAKTTAKKSKSSKKPTGYVKEIGHKGESLLIVYHLIVSVEKGDDSRVEKQIAFPDKKSMKKHINKIYAERMRFLTDSTNEPISEYDKGDYFKQIIVGKENDCYKISYSWAEEEVLLDKTAKNEYKDGDLLYSIWMDVSNKYGKGTDDLLVVVGSEAHAYSYIEMEKKYIRKSHPDRRFAYDGLTMKSKELEYKFNIVPVTLM